MLVVVGKAIHTLTLEKHFTKIGKLMRLDEWFGEGWLVGGGGWTWENHCDGHSCDKLQTILALPQAQNPIPAITTTAAMA